METNYKVVKRFDVGSVCKIVFILDLILITIILVPFSIYLIVMGQQAAAFGYLIAILIHPIMVTLGAVLSVFFYNLLAGKLGGIKVQLD